MKFGNRIREERYEPWAKKYLQYNALKKIISLISTAKEKKDKTNTATKEEVNYKLRDSLFEDKWKFISTFYGVKDGNVKTGKDINTVSVDALSSYFFHILDNELVKTITFSDQKSKEINRQMTSSRVAKNRKQQVDAMHLSAILISFVELNYTGFYKILKKFDKNNDTNTLVNFMEKVDHATQKMNSSSAKKTEKEEAEQRTILSKNLRKKIKESSKNATKNILMAIRVGQNAMSALDLSLTGAEKSEMREGIADKVAPIINPLIIKSSISSSDGGDDGKNNGGGGDDVKKKEISANSNMVELRGDIKMNDSELLEIATRNLEIMQVKVDTFASLLKIFALQVSQLDPEMSEGLLQLLNTHKMLFSNFEESQVEETQIDGGKIDSSDTETDVEKKYEQKLKQNTKNTNNNNSPLTALKKEIVNTLERGYHSTDSSFSNNNSSSDVDIVVNTNQSEKATKERKFSEVINEANFNEGVTFIDICKLCVNSCCAVYYNSVFYWIWEYDFKKNLLADFNASLAISMVGIPQSIAYSSLIGIAPEYGCYSVIFPALIYGMFGSSKKVAVGPMSIPALLIGAMVDELLVDSAASEDKATYVFGMTILTGFVLILLAILQIGVITTALVSRPVLKGFSAAAAVVVILSQLKHVFGISSGKKGTTIQSALPNIITKLPETNMLIVFYSLIGFLFYMALRYCKNANKIVPRMKSKSSSVESTASSSSSSFIPVAAVSNNKIEEGQLQQSSFSPLKKGNKNYMQTKSQRICSNCFSICHPIVILLIVGILFGASACQFVPFTTNGNDNNSNSVDINLPKALGRGASLPYHVYQESIQSFKCQHSATTDIEYKATGSGDGINSILQNEVDFAGTDVKISNSSLIKYNVTNKGDIILIPTMATSVCAFANVFPDIISVDKATNKETPRLILRPKTIARIFRRNITRWDHDTIQRENPNLAHLLPSAGIKMIVRKDGSGTTSIFTEALSLFDTDFHETIGFGKTVNWNAGRKETDGNVITLANYNQGVIDFVDKTPFSIGYAVSGDVEVKNRKLHCISIFDVGNNPIIPNKISVQTAIDATENNGKDKLSLMSQTVLNTPEAWPISSYTFFALWNGKKLRNGIQTCKERLAVLHYMKWFYSATINENIADNLNFITLPKEQRENIVNKLSTQILCPFGKPSLVDTNINVSTSEIAYCSDKATTGTEEGFYACSNIAMIGPFHPKFATPAIPSIGIDVYLRSIVNCFLLSVVIFVEHSANVKLYTSYTKQKNKKNTLNDNHELFALGLSNIVGGLCSAYVTGGGFSRSAISDKAGAKSQMSLLLSSIICTILLFVFAPALAYLPKFVIAIIIICAVAGLVDIDEFKFLWNLSKKDFLSLALAFILTLTLGITNGLLLSVGLSVILFLTLSAVPHTALLGRAINSTDYRAIDDKMFQIHLLKKMIILRFEAPLFFGNVETLKRVVNKHLHDNSNENIDDGIQKFDSIILDFSCVAWIDSTAIHVLMRLVKQVKKQKIAVKISKINSKVYNKLKLSGAIDIIGKVNFYLDTHSAVNSILRQREKNNF